MILLINMSDKPTSFQDLVKSSQDKEDPYALDQFEGPKKESRLKVKYNRIKNTFLGDGGLSSKFLMGMKMGFTVGGIFGTLAGCAAYYQTRNILYIPISALSMGASFAFFLGVGTVVRTDDSEGPRQLALVEVEPDRWEVVEIEEEWKRRYRVSSSLFN